MTAEQMQNLSVKDTAFADLQSVGVDPYAVSPANRGLASGKGGWASNLCHSLISSMK